MTNPDFVDTITSQQQRGIDQAWVKRALQAFPDADSLRSVTGPWDREMPHIRDAKLIPASQAQSGASSATSLSDTSIVVSGCSSQSRRHKRRKTRHTSRNQTRSASRSAPSSSRSAQVLQITQVSCPDLSSQPQVSTASITNSLESTRFAKAGARPFEEIKRLVG